MLTPAVVEKRRLWTWFVTFILFFTAAGGTAPSALRSDERPVHRFLILGEFQGQAVLDRETQLIWERIPSSAETRWANAGLLCAMKSVGGQRGWRLPTFFELMTLVDPAGHSATTGPLLPAGNPFTGIGEQAFWSSNTLKAESAKAYAVDFLIGDVTAKHKHSAHRIWCVRSGSAPPVQKHEHEHREGHHWS
jgi:hypothetical protein